MIKAVIFDMDGVLINTEKYLVKYWCQAAEELGMPMKREHALMIRSFSGKFAEPWLKGIYGETFDYVAVRERRKEIMAEHLAKNGVEIKPGVKETLNYLREKDTNSQWQLRRIENGQKHIWMRELTVFITPHSMVRKGDLRKKSGNNWYGPLIYRFYKQRIEKRISIIFCISAGSRNMRSKHMWTGFMTIRQTW